MLKKLKIYFSAVILGQKNIKGYSYKPVESSPLVGAKHFVGYELINELTGKVLYRKGKYWGTIDDRWDSSNYRTIRKFFFKNV